MSPQRRPVSLPHLRAQVFWDWLVECVGNFFGGPPRAPGVWFYSHIREQVRSGTEILELAREQELSEEEQLWIAALQIFRDYVRELSEHPPDDRQNLKIIRRYVDLIEPLVIGPLVKPTSGTNEDWEIYPGCTWAAWNEFCDPRRRLLEASHQVSIRSERGIRRPYGLVEGEQRPYPKHKFVHKDHSGKFFGFFGID